MVCVSSLLVKTWLQHNHRASGKRRVMLAESEDDRDEFWAKRLTLAEEGSL